MTSRLDALGGPSLFLALSALLGLACGDDGAPTVDAATLCAVDADCDDGIYCNGVESCDPTSRSASLFGCVPGERPCLADQSCEEVSDSCVTDCDVELDADGDGSDAVECGGDDCDDSDAQRFPGNREICDGADHDEDCDPETFGDKDTDGDGAFDAACCNGDNCGTDCDDLNRGVAPDASEVCDGFDNDCDATVDEGVLVEGFEDADGDGRGNPDVPMSACADAPRFSIHDDDCDDADITRNGAQVEICDEVDNDCDETVDESPTAVTWYFDGDGDSFGNAGGGTVSSCAPVDGHSLLGTDCDDSRRGVSPVGVEQCNARDDDCNGLADYVVGVNDGEDDDGDGVADVACVGIGTDCGDDDLFAGPDIPELCEDGVDNDCDGLVDEDAPAVEWRPDLDGDGFGDPDGAAVMDCHRLEGRAPRGGDCDDSSAEVRPTQLDGCDGIDDDCDGTTDEDAVEVVYYEDRDGDGVGAGAEILACRAGSSLSPLGTDCDDDDAARSPTATELCDGVDQDCDETIDEGALLPVYADVDGDGYGDDGSVLAMACTAGASQALVGGDCDDAAPSVFPMATEVCNGVDDDCDGTTDEGTDVSCMDGSTMAACTEGRCVITSCSSGFADCDGDPANGCERELMSDPAACGGCANVCAPGAECASGACETAIAAIAAGSESSCVVWASGTLACWGRNTSGQLGVSNLSLLTAQPVLSGLSGVTAVDNYRSRLCAETGAGFYCWGDGVHGTQGNYSVAVDGTLGSISTPTLVDVSDYTQISNGGDHLCARRSTGTVQCWGGNPFGQLGDGSTTLRTTPVTVVGLSDATMVATGNEHSCALRTGGTVVCWGRNFSGQIGDSTALQRETPLFDVTTGNPTDPADTLDQVTAVAAAGRSSCALRSTGEVWCWGHNTETGDGSGTTTTVAFPVQTGAGALGSIVELQSGPPGYCAIQEIGTDRTLWCWGNFPPGNGDATATSVAVQLPAITDVAQVAVGQGRVLLLRETGELLTWGNNTAEDILGIGVPSDTLTPLPTAYVP